MAYPDGLWLSFIRSAPGPFPDDGIVIINPLNGQDFTGYHYRSAVATPIDGKFTPGTGSAADHIEFTEVYNGVTYTYYADIFQLRPNYYVTTNGKRVTVVPVAADDDWVGTHTT